MENYNKQILVLPGLEGNPPVIFTPLQRAMEPFLPEIVAFWWTLWVCTLFFVVLRFVITPLWEKYNHS